EPRQQHVRWTGRHGVRCLVPRTHQPSRRAQGGRRRADRAGPELAAQCLRWLLRRRWRPCQRHEDPDGRRLPGAGLARPGRHRPGDGVDDDLPHLRPAVLVAPQRGGGERVLPRPGRELRGLPGRHHVHLQAAPGRGLPRRHPLRRRRGQGQLRPRRRPGHQVPQRDRVAGAVQGDRRRRRVHRSGGVQRAERGLRAVDDHRAVRDAVAGGPGGARRRRGGRPPDRHRPLQVRRVRQPGPGGPRAQRRLRLGSVDLRRGRPGDARDADLQDPARHQRPLQRAARRADPDGDEPRPGHHPVDQGLGPAVPLRRAVHRPAVRLPDQRHQGPDRRRQGAPGDPLRRRPGQARRRHAPRRLHPGPQLPHAHDAGLRGGGRLDVRLRPGEGQEPAGGGWLGRRCRRDPQQGRPAAHPGHPDPDRERLRPADPVRGERAQGGRVRLEHDVPALHHGGGLVQPGRAEPVGDLLLRRRPVPDEGPGLQRPDRQRLQLGALRQPRHRCGDHGGQRHRGHRPADGGLRGDHHEADGGRDLPAAVERQRHLLRGEQPPGRALRRHRLLLLPQGDLRL
ncbi:MAG: Dipeptide-binding ABC transporter, periplasmic substrate-binding component, partial [uncultured Friedmanniella sp.]